MNNTAPNFTAHQLCKHCNGGDWDEVDNDDVIVLCDCCMAVGAHLECLRWSGVNISAKDLENPAFQWFCSEDCTRVAQGLVNATNQRRKLEKTGMFTTELVRYSEKFRTSQQIVGSVVTMFRSVFARSDYSDGSDLVELVCQGANHLIPNADPEDQPPDCSNFLNFVLRKSGHIVAAAAVRARGTLLAEVPYVVTKEGYRREGHCRRLMAALEGLLRELGVEWIVVPGVEATVSMWKDHLGEESAEQLQERIIVPEGTKILLKKVSSEAPAAAAAPPANVSHKRVRFSMPLEEPEDSYDDKDSPVVNARKKAKQSASGKGKSCGSSGNDDDFTMDDCSDADDDDEEDEDDAMAVGCSKCGEHQKHPLTEDEDTGDMLCDACCGKPSGSAAAGGSGGGQVCYHCGTDEHSKYHKHSEGTGWECGTCCNYRKTHNGDLRPAKLFKRKKRGAAAISTASASAGAAAAAAAVKTPTPNRQPSGAAVAPRFSAILSGSGILSIPGKAANRGRRLKDSLGLHSSRLLKFAADSEEGAAVMARVESSLLTAAASEAAGKVAVAVVKLGGGADAKLIADLHSHAAEREAGEKQAEEAAAAAAAAQAAAEATAAAETERRLKAEAEVQALRELVLQMQVAQKESREGAGAPKEPSIPSIAAGGGDGGGGGKPLPSFEHSRGAAEFSNPALSLPASEAHPSRSPGAADNQPRETAPALAAAVPPPAPRLFALFEVSDDAGKQGSGETIIDDNEETAEEDEDQKMEEEEEEAEMGGEGDNEMKQHVKGAGDEENVQMNSPTACFDKLLQGPEVLCSQGSQAKKV